MFSRRSSILALVFSSLSVQAMFGLAAEAVEIRGKIVETYADYANTDGGVLVGLSFASESQSIEVTSMRGLVPIQGAWSTACFEATTDDGLYNARGRLVLPTQDGYRKIKPHSGWEYIEELKKYRPDQFAAVMIMGDDCFIIQDKSIISPIWYDATRPSHLNAYINPGHASTVSATLISVAGESSIKGKCRKKEGRITSFSVLCSFSMVDIDPGNLHTMKIRYWPENSPPIFEYYKILMK